ncbi:lipoprotein LpqH [Gulosibacter molinativorax]|uniref:Lipoprotein LpqH n=1 Tax=Gulosibacter molinativorax TaxID=256821 RepID=A0ABT7C9W2_9MICO|nr:lipoprotein LpqH [Gulosibacter molinativorax]MDJ1371992.1 hypothetical protein [Gulosibacter molinativorax]QUY62643.1 Hypotetical protein [Gulosibacter molinativorax]
MKRKYLAALGTSFALVAALTACSSGNSDEPTPVGNSSNNDASAPAQEDTSNGAGGDTTEDAPADGGNVSSGAGSAEVIIDGETIDIPNPNVQCGESGDTFAIAVTSPDLAEGTTFGALLTAGDSPTVSTVALAQSDGVSVAYTEGTGGAAEVTVDGNTYTISGSGMGVDATDPASAGDVEFSFTVTCP